MDYLPIQHNIDICEHGVDCKTCCWHWTAAKSPRGYGRTSANCYGEVETYAHRIMWAYYHERRVPKSMVVSHTCGNTSCCNPTHLELITYSQCRLKMRKNTGGGNVKLTEEEAAWAWAVGKSHKKTQVEIARELGVSQVCISMILRGKTWRHLQSENQSDAARERVAVQVG